MERTIFIDLTKDTPPPSSPRPPPQYGSRDNPVELGDDDLEEGEVHEDVPPYEPPPQLHLAIPSGTAGAPIEIYSPDDIVTHASIEKVPSHNVPGVLTLFCDGSFVGHAWGGAGVAYHIGGRWRGRSIALGNISSSFDAEALALLEALTTAITHHYLNPPIIKIYTDARTVLSTIKDGKEKMGYVPPRSRNVVAQILQRQEYLIVRGYDVTLHWVKGHHLSIGNELADKLATKGSEHSSMWRHMGEVRLSDQEIAVLASRAGKQTIAKRLRRCTRTVKAAARRLQPSHRQRDAVLENLRAMLHGTRR